MLKYFLSSPAVKNQATGNFILHAKGKEAKTQVFIEMGLEWEYTVEDGKESLKTSGPLHEAISVLVSVAVFRAHLITLEVVMGFVSPTLVCTIPCGHHSLLFSFDGLLFPSLSNGIASSPSPPLCLQVIPQEEEEARSSLMYRYIIHEDLLPMIGNNNVLLEEMDSYEWALKSWSQCSKACGGGTFPFIAAYSACLGGRWGTSGSTGAFGGVSGLETCRCCFKVFLPKITRGKASDLDLVLPRGLACFSTPVFLASLSVGGPTVGVKNHYCRAV